MQPEVLQSILLQDLDEARLYGLEMDNYTCVDYELYSSITTPEDSSIITSESYFHTMLPSDHISKLPYVDDSGVVLPMENISQHVEGIEDISGTSLDDVLRWWATSEEMDSMCTDVSMENEGVRGGPSVKSNDTPVMSPSMNLTMVLPMEVEGQTSLGSLLKAYGEAMEMGQRELANAIVGCLNEKASPLGGTMERVAFNLFHSGNQIDYIKQESTKNYKSAFKAFYECFPYGRFPHFAANSAILEAIMNDSRKVHIIDFDMGEGVQWPPMLEAIGKLKREIKLTSIRTNYAQSYSFEETKNRLSDYANRCGLKLEVQDVGIEDLVWEIVRSHGHDFLAFNCMVGLPHMGRRRNRSEVMEFVRAAKNLLLTNKGILTFGDGEDWENTNVSRGFGSFFDDYLKHYHALCESMERSFPENLTEARLAMETLFVGPYVSSLSWYQKWQNDRGDYGFKEDIGLMGWRLSKESLMEAKEMVNERQSAYSIRLVGQNNNEMVLQWRGTPLVRVSAWK
ncbi:putative transcription factor GRAS family [Helianthus annuus]|nr:putative transcription factor GRAS family [Helianthus annuus]KAJ0644426.1 putative transcription factor GRAS family [Helianthus annuus]KAJ0820760.1 putative transcription factor GRAS family [Helianthus annuus]KAJ0835350.1 putative transcription factor GRAS family [Helianthus annuus]